MPTLNQLVRKGRKRKRRRKPPTFKGKAPFLKGTVKEFYVVKPRKPNSAHRKIAKVTLSDGQNVTAFVPGEDAGKIPVQVHGSVLVKRRRKPDIGHLGVKYEIIRGVYDCLPPQKGRVNGRSKYGIRRPKGK